MAESRWLGVRDEYRVDPGGPSLDGGLGDLRAWHGQQEPAIVCRADRRSRSVGGTNNWSSGFLPAVYQGTQFRRGNTPILDLKPPAGVSDEQERNELGLLKRLNEIWSRDKQEDTELDARVRSYELAYEMQSAASEAVDLGRNRHPRGVCTAWISRKRPCSAQTV